MGIAICYNRCKKEHGVIRRLAKISFWLVVLGIAVLIGIDRYIAYASAPYIYTDIAKVPHKRAALLLGTTKYVAKGRKNYFYLYRIEAAAKLWKAHKVDAIVVSGDNGTRYYDETTAMYRDLIRAGVPARYITRDYAGFRTLDSVVRAGMDFGLRDYIIVTQRFHLERAIFIARAKGQQVIGYAAHDIPGTAAAYRMKLRELLARVKAFADLYVLGTMPKFYGGKEKVRYR
jgi:SanA protein